MSVSGDYKVTMNTPMGSQDMTVSLVEDGNSLSGKIAGAQGTQEFDGGTVDGNNASWKVKMTQPMPIELEIDAVVDGDTIKGNVKLGAFGNATFEGARV